jgi:NAD(P)-dependent dehydrogenase (short-subunit alcohol dehydrogenase family)
MSPEAGGAIDLGGRLAVVTGGGRGIGSQIATRLSAAGAAVALLGRQKEDLEAVAQQIHRRGGRAIALKADVTVAEAVAAAQSTLAQEFAGVDLLVNNAGILGDPGRWWKQPAEAWWRVLEVNLKGAMLCTQAFLPGMLAKGGGRIINMGSNAGVTPTAGLGPYAVSKAALLRLTDSLATDLEGTGVRVFAVSPGLVKTDLSRGLPAFNQIPEDQWLPAGRVADLCLTIAGGRLDRLSGRYLHAGQDMAALPARADLILAKDLYKLRIQETAES